MRTKPVEINGHPLPISFRQKESARKFVDEVFPTGYAKKSWLSDTVGYPVYRSTSPDYHGYICEFEDHFEINFGDSEYLNPTGWGGFSLNVWYL